MADLRSMVKRHLVPLVRRGHRVVVWSDPQFDLGNYLYLWQQAWLRQQEGLDCRVRRNVKIEPWLAHFPQVRDRLDVTADRVRFQDQRDLGHFQQYGVDFTSSDNEVFVREVVLPSPSLPEPVGPSPRSVTLNVRRGDYYSDVEFRGRYSFDIAEYVRTALELTEQRDGAVDHVDIVSDGIDWCRDRLAWIEQPGRRVTFADGVTPMEAFARVSSARRLILTNSTFSYWAAHVSTVRHGDNHSLVYAPWFHRRDIDAGASWHLDPRWTVVRDIRGGWDA